MRSDGADSRGGPTCPGLVGGRIARAQKREGGRSRGAQVKAWADSSEHLWSDFFGRHCSNSVQSLPNLAGIGGPARRSHSKEMLRGVFVEDLLGDCRPSGQRPARQNVMFEYFLAAPATLRGGIVQGTCGKFEVIGLSNIGKSMMPSGARGARLDSGLGLALSISVFASVPQWCRSGSIQVVPGLVRPSGRA